MILLFEFATITNNFDALAQEDYTTPSGSIGLAVILNIFIFPEMLRFKSSFRIGFIFYVESFALEVCAKMLREPKPVTV